MTSRRNFLSTVAATISIGLGASVASGQQPLSAPRTPPQMDRSVWNLSTTTSENDHFEWVVTTGADEEMATNAENETEIELKPTSYFAAHVRQIRPFNQDGSDERTCIGYGPLSHCFGWSGISGILDFGSDRPTTPEGQSMALFENWLGNEYTNDLDIEDGIQGPEIGSDYTYSNPDTDVLETHTVSFETDGGWLSGFSQRGFLAIETPNQKRSFLAVGGVFPDDGDSYKGFESDDGGEADRILNLMRNTTVFIR